MLNDPDGNVDRTTDMHSGELNALGTQLIDVLACRRSIPPLRLTEPGPSLHQIERLLTVGVRVPDHGVLEPWRLILVQGASREELGARLAAAFLETNVGQEALASDLAIRKIKAAFAAPVVVIVVSRINPSARIPQWEQILSAGAVCMNLVMAASALGYGSTWLTGWAAYDPAGLRILGVRPNEKIAGIIPIGTASEGQQDRARPALHKLVTAWVPR
jgi:nitroreductase